MKPLNSIRNLPLIILIIFSLILFFVVYFVFFPAVKEFWVLSKGIREKKLNLLSIESFNTRRSVLKEDFEKKNCELKVLKSRFFWEKDISKFLNELTFLASDLPIEFISLKPEVFPAPLLTKDKTQSKKSADDPLAQVAIAVSFRSDYANMINFLKRIEQGNKIIRINSLTIETQLNNLYTHNVNMGLSILIEKDLQGG